MKYSTNQFTKVTGLSADTLRYYEKNKICMPQKNEVNQYREYSAQDAMMLFMAKLCRQLDIPVGEISTLIQEEKSLEQTVSAKIEEIELQIKRLQLLKERLVENQDQYQTAVQQEGEVLITKLPSMYKLQSSLNSDEVQKSIKMLVEEIPFVVPSFTMRKDRLGDENDVPVYIGLHVLEKYIQQLGIAVNPLLTYYPKGVGMKYTVWIKDLAQIDKLLLQRLIEALEEKGYALAEDISVILRGTKAIEGSLSYLVTLTAKIKQIT